MFLRRNLLWKLLLLLGIACDAWAQNAPADTAQKIVADRKNSRSSEARPYVILISSDGFRFDYAKKFRTKHLLAAAKKGIRTPYMEPAFPSMTFPNHYTLVTGLYPAHHGIVNNSFYDRLAGERYSTGDKKVAYNPYYYGGDPLWVLAEKQQMLSACFYWVGSEAPIQGIRPTYYYLYSDSIAIDQRLQIVKNWLQLPEAQRPHLITFYLPQVDHESHHHGIDGKETKEAVEMVDHAIGRLTSMVDSLDLPVNYIFVSDHGMAEVDTLHTVLPPDADTTKFVRVSGDIMVSYYAKDTSYIPGLYEQLKSQAGNGYDVYLRTQTPARWHYGMVDDRHNRIGDVFLVARYPTIFAWGKYRVYPGRHGFDPQVVTNMRATFMA